MTPPSIHVVDLGTGKVKVTDMGPTWTPTPAPIPIPNPSPAPIPVPSEPLVIHWQQHTPAATWTAPHLIGRKPMVQVIVGNEWVLADVEYPNESTVVVTFPTPQSGEMVLA